MRWLLTRGFVVLGGSIALTAVAWAIAAGSAAAESSPVDGLGIGADTVSVAVDTVGEAASRVTDALPGEHGRETVHAIRTKSTEPLQVPLSQQQPSCDTELLDCAGGVVGTESEAPTAIADALGPWLGGSGQAPSAATEVDAATMLDALFPGSASMPWSPRTTSGLAGLLGGTGDAPAHSPASVPPLQAPSVAAASGYAAGSSPLPALVGLPAAHDVVGAGNGEAVRPAHGGRPNTAGAQPGTEPD